MRRTRLGRTLLIKDFRGRSGFFRAHPIIASIIIVLLFLLANLVTSAMAEAVHIVQGGMNLSLALGVESAFFSMMFFIIIESCLIMSEDMVFGKSIIAGILFSIPFVAYLIMVSKTFASGGAITADIVGDALLAGVTEEVAFRFIPVVCFKRPGVKRISDVKVALFSGILFAAYHIPNIAFADNILKEMVGIVFALFIGTYFAGLYIKSGMLVPCMLMHVINNILSLKAPESIKAQVFALLVGVGLFVFTIVVMRKESYIGNFLIKAGRFLSKSIAKKKKKPAKPVKPVMKNPEFYRKKARPEENDYLKKMAKRKR